MSFDHDLDDTPLDDTLEFVSMQKYTKAQGEIHRKNEDNLRRFQDIEKRQQMYCVTIIMVVVVGMAVGIAGIAVSVKGKELNRGDPDPGEKLNIPSFYFCKN